MCDTIELQQCTEAEFTILKIYVLHQQQTIKIQPKITMQVNLLIKGTWI